MWFKLALAVRQPIIDVKINIYRETRAGIAALFYEPPFLGDESPVSDDELTILIVPIAAIASFAK